MGKTTAAAQSEVAAIKSAASKGTKRAAKAVVRDSEAGHVKAKPRKATGNNDYLGAVVDPEFSGKGRGIPDDETMPSVKFQTSLVDVISSNAAGDYVAFHTPAVTNGGYHPTIIYPGGFGTPETAFLSALCPTASAFNGATIAGVGPTVFTSEVVHDVIATATKTAIEGNFAAIRPVSMVMKFTPTEAALTAQGSLRAGTMSRQQSPGAQSVALHTGLLTVNGNPIAANNIPEGLGFLAPSNPVLEDLASGSSFAGNITKTVNLVWRFEDVQDYIYRTTQSEQPTNAAGGFTDNWWYFFDTESCGAYPSIIDGGTASTSLVWVFPGSTSYTGAEEMIADRPFANWVYPTAYWMVRGASPSTVLGEVRIIINWEAIPIVGVQSIMATTPSPSNPNEVSQVGNVVPYLPAAYDPNNSGAPETKMFNAAAKSTGDLYNETPPKEALEGTSVLKKVGGGLAKAASAILPFPLSLVATGAEALMGML